MGEYLRPEQFRYFRVALSISVVITYLVLKISLAHRLVYSPHNLAHVQIARSSCGRVSN